MKFTQNGVAVIGIDHGYGNIKTANSVTLTGVTAYDSKPTFIPCIWYTYIHISFDDMYVYCYHHNFRAILPLMYYG